MAKSELTTRELAQTTWKGNKKQRNFIEYWVNPQSETFGNAYRSGLKAGFSNSYSLNITHLAPHWLSENIAKLNLDEEHIKQGIYDIALNTNNSNSKSPNDTKLKAYEALMNISGLGNKHSGVTNNILVQPILNGSSVTRQTIDTTPTKVHDVVEAELIPD